MMLALATQWGRMSDKEFMQMIHLRKLINIFVGFVTLFLSATALAHPSTPDENTWITNGPVYAIKKSPDGSRTYIGGNFSTVGPYTGSGVPTELDTGVAVAPYPKANAVVRATASDGSGGWYIGGDFTQVGGQPRNRLAHIMANGTVDPNWDPSPNGPVNAIVYDSTQKIVYVGGYFNKVGGAIRSSLAALDGAAGLAKWTQDPAVMFSQANQTTQGIVYALALDSNNSTLYVGGYFTNVGGAQHISLAAVTTSNGTPTSGANAWTTNVTGVVYSLAYVANSSTNSQGPMGRGPTLYVGGFFTSAWRGGTSQPRYNLAALDASNGTILAWNPPVLSNGNAANASVTALGFDSGTQLVYVGGRFDSITNAQRNNLAALVASNGSDSGWNPNVTVNGNASLAAVSSILVTTKESVYVAGAFTRLLGEVRNGAAGISTGIIAAGASPLLPWNPNANAAVYSLAMNGNEIYAGGYFNSLGGQLRNFLAALDNQGVLIPNWDPLPDNIVRAIDTSADGSLIYVGGDFNNLNSAGSGAGGAFFPHRMTGRIRSLDGSVDSSWNVNVTSGTTVYAISATSNTIYIGGDFAQINNTSRVALAAVRADGSFAWDPGLSQAADEIVYALAARGSKVYVGGLFQQIGGAPFIQRSNIAELDDVQQRVALWNPKADSSVRALVISPDGSTIYVGGRFTSFLPPAAPQMIPSNKIAKINASNSATMVTSSWSSANNDVYALALEGTDLYVGGNFTSVGAGGNARARNGLAVLDTGGDPTAWNPNLSFTTAGSNVGVRSLGVNGSTVYAGGDYIGMGGRNWLYFAGFVPPTVTPPPGGSGGGGSGGRGGSGGISGVGGTGGRAGSGGSGGLAGQGGSGGSAGGGGSAGIGGFGGSGGQGPEVSGGGGTALLPSPSIELPTTAGECIVQSVNPGDVIPRSDGSVEVFPTIPGNKVSLLILYKRLASQGPANNTIVSFKQIEGAPVTVESSSTGQANLNAASGVLAALSSNNDTASVVVLSPLVTFGPQDVKFEVTEKTPDGKAISEPITCGFGSYFQAKGSGCSLTP
ncbi:MAG: delta-60 repeat domain-containing protein [Deltaproteobacteria bacterium]|nr:delta-60 repeat domain-containing protein [Deltaproteobacteria bacterium]